MAIIYADTVATMTTGSGVAAIGDTIILGGYFAVGDGGGGTFLCIASAGSWTVDNGLLFVNGATTKYYQRLVNTPYISVKWFGALGNNFDDDFFPINTAFKATSNGNTVMTDGADSTRTRIYFPAGVYVISRPIADYVSFNYEPYVVSGLEIVGERAVIRTVDPVAFGNEYGMQLSPVGSVNLKGITFKGFNRALTIHNNTDVSNVSLDCINFQDHSQVTLTYNCPKGALTIDNTSWLNCTQGLFQHSGDTTIRTSKMHPAGWIANERSFITVNEPATLSIKNSICIPPRSPNNPYAHTCSWINAVGSVRVVNTKFTQPLSPMDDNEVGQIITFTGTGRTWANSESESRIVFKDCFCDCSRSAIRLKGIPNVIICKHNTGFSNTQFLIKYDNATSIDTILTNMYGLFSMEIDNIPFYGTANWESNKLYSHNNPNSSFPIPYKDQLKFLPYVRVNAGLDSYGYAENFTYPSSPSIVKFFMGKQSYDSSDSNNSAIFGDYSFEVKLVGVSTYDPNSGNYHEGAVCMYNNYRVRCKVIGSVTQIDSIESIGTEDTSWWAPRLINDSSILKVCSQGHDVGGTWEYERYCIYYQIRTIVSPHVQAFNG